MKARKSTLRLAAVLFCGSIAAGLAVACSGDDNNGNPAPTTDSGSADNTAPGQDSSSSSSSGGGGDTSTPPNDGPSLDTGSCKSDASTCNSCYTAAQAAADPYNACSKYTAACIPFDPTRVPTHPTL